MNFRMELRSVNRGCMMAKDFIFHSTIQ